MTERVCEFKWPRSSSLGQCTSVFSSFDELYYSHVHVFTSLHTYSINLWINLFYVFGRFSDITARQTCNHLCICQYFYPKGIHVIWTHDFGIADADTLSLNIFRHTQTEKAVWITRRVDVVVFSAFADFITSIDLEDIQSQCSRS